MKKIIKLLKNIKYKENVSFKTMTSFKTGGNISLVIYPKNIKELKKVLMIIKFYKKKYYIIGNGTNILAGDNDFDGVVISLKSFDNYEIQDDVLYVQSGCNLSLISYELCKKGYDTFDYSTAIPGTIGGAIYMNAGAYGKEIKDSLIETRVLNKFFIKTYKNSNMKFGKRYSILQDKKDSIILDAKFKLNSSDEDIMQTVTENNSKRKKTQPLEYPNAGSIFKNPEGYYAGKLIEDLGLKGYRVGGAKISEKHANFIVNDNNATSLDILNIIEYVQMKVLNEYKIKLELEIKLINF